jgi:polygalacturonase
LLDFGADPTGATTSTPAIGSAIAHLVGGGTIYVPSGAYKIAAAPAKKAR